jgi:hypothetical protein
MKPKVCAMALNGRPGFWRKAGLFHQPEFEKALSVDFIESASV